VTPSTPACGTGTTTGTACETGTGGRFLTSDRPAPRSGSSSILAGRSAMPTRRWRASASWRRRSQSRCRGPVAVSSTSAGSGNSARRRTWSARRNCSRWEANSAMRRRYSFMAWRCCFLPYRLSLHHCVINDSGVSRLMSRNHGVSRTNAMTMPPTPNTTLDSSCNRWCSGRVGCAGTSIVRTWTGASNLGGRL
jgi:hypothetical protein